ncbi:MAG: tRNA (guanosine(46)-N7)-methyltransferase TrmB [Saprospiraceae bacterium]
MAKNKLKKFDAIRSYDFVIENPNPKVPKLMRNETEEVDLKGNWAQKLFQNDQPIVLELACGRGEYTVALAEAYPDKNFIGLDVKGARIWKGATIVEENGLKNAAFLRTRIEQIALFFAEQEIDEIWITFPDPFTRASKENKRLTSPAFLNRYKPLLKPKAHIHLKTDDDGLFQFTREVLSTYENSMVLYENDDIYAQPLAFNELTFKTYYERAHLEVGRTIKYIRFTIN